MLSYALYIALSTSHCLPFSEEYFSHLIVTFKGYMAPWHIPPIPNVWLRFAYSTISLYASKTAHLISKGQGKIPKGYSHLWTIPEISSDSCFPSQIVCHPAETVWGLSRACKSWLKPPNWCLVRSLHASDICLSSYMPQFFLWKVNQLLLWGKASCSGRV